MEPEALRSWIEGNGYTVVGLARALEVERKTVHRWLAGESRIPRSVELALEVLAEKK